MDIDSKQFSEREKDVIQLLLLGKSNKQIASELGIAIRTVEFHLSNVYAKLGVNSRSEAILKFTREPLRESTGEDQRKSTVDGESVSTENGSKPNFRSIVMKKTSYILAGVSAAILVAIIVLLQPADLKQEAPPATSVQQATAAGSNIPSLPILPSPKSTEPISTLPAAPLPTSMAIPPHTVNGYTATIESYYADATHILFQVQLAEENPSAGREYLIAAPNLYNEYGQVLNASVIWQPAIDPTLYQFEFIPTTPLTGDHVKGQFSFEVDNAVDLNRVEAQFLFDFDIPIYPETRFDPKQKVTANDLEIYLDSVTVSPTFTQLYVCFPPPSSDLWIIGSQTILKVGGQEFPLYTFSELFDSITGSFWGIRSEPNWTPPAKQGSCDKLVFPVGSTNPAILTLIIPELEKSDTSLFLTDQLAQDYPGLSKEEAYHKYLEEHDRIYKGPWVFTVEFIP